MAAEVNHRSYSWILISSPTRIACRCCEGLFIESEQYNARCVRIDLHMLQLCSFETCKRRSCLPYTGEGGGVEYVRYSALLPRQLEAYSGGSSLSPTMHSKRGLFILFGASVLMALWLAVCVYTLSVLTWPMGVTGLVL